VTPVPDAERTGPDLREQVERLLAEPAPWPIAAAGHPVLRRPAVRYDARLDDLLAALVEGMRVTMHEAPGVGLAAPQIGLGLALAVLEDPGAVDGDVARVRERSPFPFRVLIDPAYAPVGSEQVAFYEGCLSVPGWQAVTPRWRSVRLSAHDETGADVDEVLTGWPARIVQHETDHLSGRLYVDRAILQSLSSDRSAAPWMLDASPERAAQVLGFDLP
jgi:peptide deformylase